MPGEKEIDRALIQSAISRLNALEREICLVRSILEPLGGKIAKVRLKSRDGRHDYTKTSLMFRKRQ
jgi:hypothetical protein